MVLQHITVALNICNVWSCQKLSFRERRIAQWIKAAPYWKINFHLNICVESFNRAPSIMHNLHPPLPSLLQNSLSKKYLSVCSHTIPFGLHLTLMEAHGFTQPIRQNKSELLWWRTTSLHVITCRLRYHMTHFL